MRQPEIDALLNALLSKQTRNIGLFNENEKLKSKNFALGQENATLKAKLEEGQFLYHITVQQRDKAWEERNKAWEELAALKAEVERLKSRDSHDLIHMAMESFGRERGEK